MKSPESLEKIVAETARNIADNMATIANNASSEEEVRHECNKLIDVFLADADISVKGRHEYGLAGGKIDSKYGGVIFEYKASKGQARLTADNKAAANKAVVAQLKRRFNDFQTIEQINPSRLFGIGCDGYYFIFVRYRGNNFEVEDPQLVTPYSVERLLRALISLGAQGHSFTPEHLEADFGAASNLAKTGVSDLYNVILSTNDAKALTFYSQWRILFREVCGYDVDSDDERIGIVARHYGIEKASSSHLLFSIHTYYAIFMKFLAAEIASSFSPLGTSIIKRSVGAATASKLRREMENLEQGGIWSQLGIANFLEGDLFSWYLPAWNAQVARVIWSIARSLDAYDPTTLSVDPLENRDLLKRLYQHLFPKEVRHSLGEYYTPDWLADFTLDEVGYTGEPDKRLLDPACGSGTFLVLAIGRVKAWFAEHRDHCGFDERELTRKILRNIIGFDLNPLAVMAARTNFLLAIRDLLRFIDTIEIPVYLCDSILTPAEHAIEYRGKKGAGVDLFAHKSLKLKTAVGDFLIPNEIGHSRELMGRYATIIEMAVREQYSTEDFLARCQEERIPVTSTESHQKLFGQLQQLDRENKNGIWARIIKNAFAPLFTERVHYVVGNPPWINWEALPEAYRDQTKHIWTDYNLLTLKGWKARVAAGRTDLSILFVVISLQQYLKESGRLGFVITQSIFKSTGGGEGLRSFNLLNTQFTALKIHDFSGSTIFEDAVNRVSISIFQRDKKVTYPVPYVRWEPKIRRGTLAPGPTEKVTTYCTAIQLEAVPSITENKQSPWLTGTHESIKAMKKIFGISSYRAREGINWGGALGVYQLTKALYDDHGRCLITNDGEAGRIKFDTRTATVEDDLIFPLVKGRDVKRWHAELDRSVIIPHPMGETAAKPFELSLMRRSYPKGFSYFNHFREKLIARKEYKRWGGVAPFYELYRIGPYTFSPFKVVFKDLTEIFQCCVVSTGGPRGHVVIPDYTLRMIPCQTEVEAFFVAGLLNSKPVNVALHATSVGVQTQRYHAGDIDKLALPRFDPQEDSHIHLAELSKRCHAAASKGQWSDIATLEDKLDIAAGAIWGLSMKSLRHLQEDFKLLLADKNHPVDEEDNEIS